MRTALLVVVLAAGALTGCTGQREKDRYKDADRPRVTTPVK
jgi:hypothetical protein